MVSRPLPLWPQPTSPTACLLIPCSVLHAGHPAAVHLSLFSSCPGLRGWEDTPTPHAPPAPGTQALLSCEQTRLTLTTGTLHLMSALPRLLFRRAAWFISLLPLGLCSDVSFSERPFRVHPFIFYLLTYLFLKEALQPMQGLNSHA